MGKKELAKDAAKKGETALTKKTTETRGVQGWLGSGIDLFKYDPINNPSTKPARILKAALDPSDVTHQSRPAGGYREIYADSALELTHKLTVQAGLKGSYGKAFSASVDSKYSISQTRTEKRHFLKIWFTLSHEDYELRPNKARLRGLLDDDCRDALAKWKPEEIFQEYGTHLVRKMTIGGRADYLCQSTDFTSITEKKFKTAAKAKYKTAGGSIEGSSSVETVDQETLNKVQGELGIEAVGGAAEAVYGLKEGKWGAWAKSCESHPAFLGFDEESGLLPIWELAADDTRKNEIHEAYKRMAAKEFRTAIVSVTSPEEKSDPEARVTVPEGYKLLSGGARIDYRSYGNMLTASFPESDTTWRANGHDMKEADKETITAFAIALYDPDDLWEVKIFKDTWDKIDVRPMREVTVGTGYVMVGGGAQVHSTETVHSNLLVASCPVGNANATWRAFSKEHYVPNGAMISVYAVGLKCKKVKGVTILSDIQQTDSESSATKTSAEIGPRSGYVMTGGGASTYLDFSQPGWGVDRNLELRSGQLLTKSCPLADRNSWLGEAKDHLYPYKTKTTVMCIGVKIVDAKIVDAT